MPLGSTQAGRSHDEDAERYMSGTGGLGRYANNQQLAAAGSAQSSAATITVKSGGWVSVSAADDAKGVILPTPDQDGYQVYVKSTVSNKILKVYPHSGAAINALSGDAAISLASGPTVALFTWDATLSKWFTLPLLPS